MTENLVSFYNQHVSLSDELLEEFSENQIESCTPSPISQQNNSIKLNSFLNMYYITDLHLNHKLMRTFPRHASKEEIIQYIKFILDKMFHDIPKITYDDYLLIGGDVSFNYEISKIFYFELVKRWEELYGRSERIVVILGNHELWDFNREGKIDKEVNLSDVIEKYKNLFEMLNITFLQNDLLVCKTHEQTVIPGSKLVCMDDEELEKLSLQAHTMILGGIGFSGYNPKFNFSRGIYRNTITTHAKERDQTILFEELYHHLKSVNKDSDNIIVFTHMPKGDWSTDRYNPKWIYVSGHTHQNKLTKNNEIVEYADNQVGYTSEEFKLNNFSKDKVVDIFKYYESGIHSISKESYLDFNRKMGIKFKMKRNGEIFMLKKHGIYLFIIKDKDNYFFLDGGSRLRIKDKNINYYYDNMVEYASIVKNKFQKLNQHLKLMSNQVKKIGGLGTIHGSIVDIDAFNHIYLNIYDGKITPYFAYNIKDKYVYNDLGTLLEKKNKKVFSNYIKLLDSGHEELKLLDSANEDIKIFEDTYEYNTTTEIYQTSNIVRKYQYLTELNIIRLWDDSLLQGKNALEKRDKL